MSVEWGGVQVDSFRWGGVTPDEVHWNGTPVWFNLLIVDNWGATDNLNQSATAYLTTDGVCSPFASPTNKFAEPAARFVAEEWEVKPHLDSFTSNYNSATEPFFSLKASYPYDVWTQWATGDTLSWAVYEPGGSNDGLGQTTSVTVEFRRTGTTTPVYSISGSASAFNSE